MNTKQLAREFFERDNEALDQLQNWIHGPITESRRLAFLEGRVADLAQVVITLLMQLDNERQSKTTND